MHMDVETDVKLKAPYTWFGGKARVADVIWSRIGDVDNAIEPFAGSLAWMLARPHKPRIETVNDVNCYVANFWRATQQDPEAVAAHADWPVNEADLHSRHRWLVLSTEAAEFREKMRTDPTHFDARIAGWWCWGLCAWIGSGWCETPESSQWEQVQLLSARQGVKSGSLNGPPGGSGERCVILGGGDGQLGHGVHAKGQLEQNRPDLRGCWPGQTGQGIHTRRPQLADAYDIGRGVNSAGQLGTCAARRAWLLDWFGRLRDRLRLVRVCCGDWSRVCSSESTTTRLGVTGVFIDGPYPRKRKCGKQSRNATIYASDSAEKTPEILRDEILAWCKAHTRPGMRICVAGYEGDGYEELVPMGWDEQRWQAQGGYGNRSETGKANAKRERLWYSPACLSGADMFDALETIT